ncbi:hypothetical protein [Wolbachia endosymbiont of Chironomus riparius]|uniref:hypothetical protein n=1 Tax=Wolbachia endosymbiont of Chironomus riparius TaxID=2883238 RepID=UPI0020A16BC6|nr:hypothetical protein [Wolbachia endosymbiont of Chironomus riparius]
MMYNNFMGIKTSGELEQVSSDDNDYNPKDDWLVKTYNTINPASRWIKGAVEDTANWTDGAVEDTANWTDGAVEDTGDWIKGAVEDTANWTDGAIEDTGDWIKGAVNSLKNFFHPSNSTNYDDINSYDPYTIYD